MIRLDPLTANPLPASPAAPPTVPAWALAAGGGPSDADAAFRAGAALARQPRPRAACLDRCLAAAASAQLRCRQHAAGRPRRGRSRLARCLVSAPDRRRSRPRRRHFWGLAATGCAAPAASADRLGKIVDQLGLHWDGAALSDLGTEIEKLAGSTFLAGGRPKRFAALEIAGEIMLLPLPGFPHGERNNAIHALPDWQLAIAVRLFDFGKSRRSADRRSISNLIQFRQQEDAISQSPRGADSDSVGFDAGDFNGRQHQAVQ